MRPRTLQRMKPLRSLAAALCTLVALALPTAASAQGNVRCPPQPPRDGALCRAPQGMTCNYPQSQCRCVDAGPRRGTEWECGASYVPYRPPVRRIPRYYR